MFIRRKEKINKTKEKKKKKEGRAKETNKINK